MVSVCEDIENDRTLKFGTSASQFNARPSSSHSEYRNFLIKTLIRVLSALNEGAETNFETDLFHALSFVKSEKISLVNYNPDGDTMSFKVIADHIQFVGIYISGDGALRVMVMSSSPNRAVMHGL